MQLKVLVVGSMMYKFKITVVVNKHITLIIIIQIILIINNTNKNYIQINDN